MQTQFKSVAIIGKYMNPPDLQNMRSDLQTLATHLQAQGIQVFIEENTANHASFANFATVKLKDIGNKANLAIVMGGDGTMLSVARSLVESNVPLVGINRGRFGFLTDLRTEGMLEAIDEILAGNFIKEPRMLLAAQVLRNGGVVDESYALNDVVIKSGLRLIEMEVVIDQNFVCKQRADGLIMSTPTGTTAYALSAGGPILQPSLDAISIVPICPHTLSNRPIVVSATSHIEVKLVQFDEAQLSFDGQHQVNLLQGDVIHLQRAEKAVALIHPSDYCYFDMLRNKLNWG